MSGDFETFVADVRAAAAEYCAGRGSNQFKVRDIADEVDGSSHRIARALRRLREEGEVGIEQRSGVSTWYVVDNEGGDGGG